VRPAAWRCADVVVGARKFRQPRIAHERLEPHGPTFGHFRQSVGIARDDATVEAEVGHGFGFERGSLGIEVGGGDGAGRGIQRHVDEHGATAGGQSAASGEGAFPIGAAWLVEMHVDIDQSRENGQTACVEFCAGSGQLRTDSRDCFTFDGDVGKGDT
jgi:hypothetical protein